MKRSDREAWKTAGQLADIMIDHKEHRNSDEAVVLLEIIKRPKPSDYVSIHKTHINRLRRLLRRVAKGEK